MTNLVTLTCLILAILASATQAQKPGSMLAYTWQRWGVMSPEEYFRLHAIQDRIGHSGKVTDQDVDFAIHTMETPPPNPKETVFRRSQAAAYLTSECKNWTAKQKGKMFQAALWLLAQPEPKNQALGNFPLTTDKFPAMYLLHAVHDKRTLPYLLKLENDSNQNVASYATTIYSQIAEDGKKQR